MNRLMQQYLGMSLGLLLAASSLGSEIESTSAQSWDSNLRWSIDLSSRYVDNREADSFFINAIGFDLHKVFSGEGGDIGTLVFQPYLVNFSESEKAPYFFDGRDSELTWRIANFNYTGLSQGQFNIRLGHFEIPFGLEQNIDTNGTLRQYTFASRGIKADWGVSVNGVLPGMDYEISLTRGSGNDITDRDSPYIVAGRIGTPSTRNFVVGLSFFQGDVLNATRTVRRERWGVDLAWYRYNWEILLEASSGKDEAIDVVDGLLELSWRSRQEAFHCYGQFRHYSYKPGANWDRGSEVALGLQWNVWRNVEVSGQWQKPLESLSQENRSATLMLQVRARI